ncbi:mechanosensitive ion channel family [Histoplasma capsulatum var. duboisii H88]|uniref:Mechanosensitive ion channel protein n=1 Tax=Ajellomyces capsulatus (strain H88) TaxID=544711 RepID=F0U6N0_AJEC8|nr:mechanosensitive ion channel family [Histoplasma capsulatum var. duboisii H88]QSS52895.1 mechanosensitive ion channel family [Histoplasma capsulatum var. duboisii H88]
MASPVDENRETNPLNEKARIRNNSSSEDGTVVNDSSQPPNSTTDHLAVHIDPERESHPPLASPSQRSQERELAHRLDDELALMEAERVVSNEEKLSCREKPGRPLSITPTRSRRSEPVDEFDAATNPLHEHAAIYNPPENPSTSLAKFFKKVHESSFLVRYFTYITPLVLILLIPLLVGLLAYPDANVGGVRLLWFSVWLEIVWLTLWAGRIVAKFLPIPMGLVASVLTNNSKKWRDLGKQLELPATLFFWWLGIEISFLPTMTNHHIDGSRGTKSWEVVVNKIIVSVFVGATLNFIEKIIIQLIAISFHLRTYADRIEINKFQIGSMAKLYAYSKEKIKMEDCDFEESPQQTSGMRTPMQYAGVAQRVARTALSRVGDVAGAVAGDFTGKKVARSNHPHQVVLTLLSTTSGSQVLARRMYRTFVRDGFDTIFSGDLKAAFDNSDEAEAAFTMFDKDMNGDISMEELEAVCVEIGRERKSITASLKDLDSVVSKLDNVFVFIVIVITILVFLSLISASTAGVLTSAGSTLLALSWLFSATAQEFLQSIVFVFIKHPFDVGDRVSIYGNTGATLTGDDYFVKEIALLYTEFKKMEGHVVQAPNSYLNTLFILNQRRSGALAEAVPIVIKFGTTIQQIDSLRLRLTEFVRSENREYQGKILTELRQVTENYSLTLNVVFFYKSNWQNELLRLQRRNKFICTLMLVLQEVGIEGPRMNTIGAKHDLPYHINHQGAPPTYNDSTNAPGPGPGPSGPETADPYMAPESRDALGGLGRAQSTGIGHHPSILRNRAGTTSSVRGRGEPVSKHVDFSLGLSELSAADSMSDVHDDRQSSNRINQIIRNANRESAERRRREQDEAEAQRRLDSLEQSRSHATTRTSIDSHPPYLPNPATLTPTRGSMSSSIHRNHLFSRLGTRSVSSREGRDRSRSRSGDPETAETELMEQGRYNPTRHNDFTDTEPRSDGVPLRNPQDDITSDQGRRPPADDRG